MYPNSKSLLFAAFQNSQCQSAASLDSSVCIAFRVVDCVWPHHTILILSQITLFIKALQYLCRRILAPSDCNAIPPQREPLPTCLLSNSRAQNKRVWGIRIPENSLRFPMLLCLCQFETDHLSAIQHYSINGVSPLIVPLAKVVN